MERATEEQIKKDCVIAVKNILKRKRKIHPEELLKYRDCFYLELRQNSPCPIEKLNNDILLYIFHFCDDWITISCVYKKWRELCKKIPFNKYNEIVKKLPEWKKEFHKDCLFFQWLLRGLYRKLVFEWIDDYREISVMKIEISLVSGNIIFKTKTDEKLKEKLKQHFIVTTGQQLEGIDISYMQFNFANIVPEFLGAVYAFCFYSGSIIRFKKNVTFDFGLDHKECLQAINLYEKSKKFKETFGMDENLNLRPVINNEILLRDWDFFKEVIYFWKVWKL